MMKIFEYIRRAVKRVATGRQTASVATILACSLSGLTKFGVTPGGGFKPGSWSSGTPGGRSMPVTCKWPNAPEMNTQSNVVVQSLKRSNQTKSTIFKIEIFS